MNDQRPDDSQSIPPEEPFVPTEEESDEAPPAPRRAASAEFIVEADVGSEAALREAMDPANQSLGEALRLSFRVLQAVIVVLIALFLVSGFKTVTEGQSGVMLRFGRIVKEDLAPGAEFNMLPYPAGEFVLFDVDGRTVETGRQFMPLIPQGKTLEEVENTAQVGQILSPSETGYVLLNNGDIAHFEGSATYRIDDPSQFAESVADGNADRIVLLALERAVVHVAAEMSLQEWTSMSEADHDRIVAKAQETLNRMNCGISVKGLTVEHKIPALAIRKIASALQAARDGAVQQIAQGQERAESELISTAGEQYADVLALIDRYQVALEAGDEEAQQRELEAVNDMLQSGLITGEVKNIVGPALSHRSTIVETLERELATFNSIYEGYKENPQLYARALWLDAFRQILDREGLEIWYLPPGEQEVLVRLTGSEEIARLRRELQLEAAKARADRAMYEGGPRRSRVDDKKRQLDIDEEGNVTGFGGGN